MYQEKEEILADAKRYKQESRELQAQVSGLLQGNSQLQAQSRELAQLNAQIQAELSGLGQVNSQLHEEFCSLGQTNAQLAAELSGVQEKGSAAQAKAGELERRNAELQAEVASLVEQNRSLQDSLNALQKVSGQGSTSGQSPKSGQPAQECEEMSGSRFRSLGEEFEARMGRLLAENYSLRGKVAHFEVDREQLEFRLAALQEEIQIYEERDLAAGRGQSLRAEEWEQLNDEIDRLREQNRGLAEKYEFEVMRKENEVEEGRPGECEDQSLSLAFFEQLKELQQSQELLKECQRELAEKERQLRETTQRLEQLGCLLRAESGKSEDLAALRLRHESLSRDIAQQARLVQSREEFIKDVLIAKINKLEDEEEIAYYLENLNRVI